MDFTPNPEQQAVADVVTSVLERDNTWDALVSGGVAALGVPERLGGDGLGLSELSTALTEIGRHGTDRSGAGHRGPWSGDAARPGFRRPAGPLPRRCGDGCGALGRAQRARAVTAGASRDQLSRKASSTAPRSVCPMPRRPSGCWSPPTTRW